MKPVPSRHRKSVLSNWSEHFDNFPEEISTNSNGGSTFRETHSDSCEDSDPKEYEIDTNGEWRNQEQIQRYLAGRDTFTFEIRFKAPSVIS